MVGTRPYSRAFEALANSYRRQLLLALLEENPGDDDEFAPRDLLGEGTTTDARAPTRLESIHVHLPKLADMGFIEWDHDAGELSRGPNWEQIAPLLRMLHEERDERPDERLSGLSSEG